MMESIDYKEKGGREIKVLETFIKGKVSDELCEDTFYMSENFIAVIDGVTSKSDFTYKGKTTGKLASEIIKDVLEKANKEVCINEIIKEINKEFTKFYQTVEFPYSKTEKGLQAVCAIYSEFYHEIWMIGDCQVAVDEKVYLNPKKSDTILAELRSLILKTIKKSEVNEEGQIEATKLARKVIEPWILKATIFANNPDSEFGYAVVNGSDIPESLIKIIKLGSDAHEVILTSDGYPQIKANLKLTEEYLNKILKEDKDCDTLFLSTKGVVEGNQSFDDRTYIRFLI